MGVTLCGAAGMLHASMHGWGKSMDGQTEHVCLVPACCDEWRLLNPQSLSLSTCAPLGWRNAQLLQRGRRPLGCVLVPTRLCETIGEGW
jgi:hypothetical protein